MNFDDAVNRVVESAGGNDAILQQVAAAFASGDTDQIRSVMSQHGGIDLSDADMQSFIQQFNAKYQADPANGRYWPT